MTTIPIAKLDDVSGGKKLVTVNGHTREIQQPHLTDEEVAGCVRMLMRSDLRHELVCTLARDRILYLSQTLTASSERRRVLEEALKPFTTVPLGGNGANERLLIISTKGAYHILESDLMRAHTSLHAEPDRSGGMTTNQQPPSAPTAEAVRCEICGWALADSPEKGCVLGSCSYRPEQYSAEWYRIRERRAALQAWDAFQNRYYEPVERRAAEIYATYEYAAGRKPDWVPHGNSLKQDEARNTARRELRDLGHIPVATNHLHNEETPGAEAVAEALFDAELHRHPNGNVPFWDIQPPEIKQSFLDKAVRFQIALQRQNRQPVPVQAPGDYTAKFMMEFDFEFESLRRHCMDAFHGRISSCPRDVLRKVEMARNKLRAILTNPGALAPPTVPVPGVTDEMVHNFIEGYRNLTAYNGPVLNPSTVRGALERAMRALGVMVTDEQFGILHKALEDIRSVNDKTFTLATAQLIAREALVRCAALSTPAKGVSDG